jgi:hypothetical protein
MSAFAAWIRSISTRGRGPIVASVTMLVVLGSATGAALAQDKGNAENSQAAQSSTTTSDLTTSNSDPTTSTSDPTTTTSDDKTTTSDDEGTTSTSEELVGPTDSTTTTSDTLNTLAADPRVEPRATTCEKIDPVTALQTATVTVGNPNDVTLTFTFNQKGDSNEATSATWSSSAPFTGDIIVKAGNEQSGGGEITYSYVNATTGTVSSPFTNQNGQTLGISHVEICGEEGTGTTPTTSTTTTTFTQPPTTTSTTVPGTTGGGGVAGTTGAGGGGGGAAGQTAEGGDQPAVAQAAQAAPAESGLAFTGLYAPLMVLVALAMGTAGFALRKRINGSA